jgi:hypothetical protein
VGGQLGKMKSMGIRSSVITTFDGANVIILMANCSIKILPIGRLEVPKEDSK